ncbi:MAG: hypothetical protein A2Z18_00245, partial [Armatimonadetes bacterium RBG_16_58_9]
MTERKGNGGLERFGLSLDDAMGLARGKRRAVARYLLNFGHDAEARDLLKGVAAENPGGMQYRMWLAWAYLALNEVDEADSISEALLSEFPDKQSVVMTRAQVMLARNDPRAAYDLWGKFANEPENGYGYWTRVGMAAQRRGDWAEADLALSRATACYEQSRAEDPESDGFPIHLWKAIARQCEHSGVRDSRFHAEIEQIRRAEEEKLRQELAKPDPKTGRSESRVKTAPLREPPDDPLPVEESDSVRMLGTDCPPNEELQNNLKDYFGFSEFRRGQQQVMEQVLAGKSVLAVMPTGAGKSLCYQLPAMLVDGVTLVVSPLIALMKDQLEGLPAVVQRQATVINSTLEGDEISRRLVDAAAGKYKLVYAAPERLRQSPFLHALKTCGVSLLVVDEAHCVSMWGHDFRPDYLFIGRALRYLGEPAVLAMTATANPRMRVEIADHFQRRLNVVSTGTHRPNLCLESIAVPSDDDKMRELARLCGEMRGSGIVYVRSRERTELLARLLRREGVKASHYHAGMDDVERTKAQDDFMDGRYRVMCATVAFGMGIDKPDVRFVIHYSPPESLESYYQEAGRAGRDGEVSRCVLLYTSGDKRNLTRWMRREMISIDLPRKCYELLRELTREVPFAAVHIDDFRRELEQDETRIRVAISLLENAGLAKRHLDVPSTATVAVTANGPTEDEGEFADFVQKARLRVGQRIAIETMDLARRTEIGPAQIERRLLDWQASGYLTYHGSGRVMLLERTLAAKDAKRRLQDNLDSYARTQERRVATMFDYAESRQCRHDLIAEHFGESHVEKCS